MSQKTSYKITKRRNKVKKLLARGATEETIADTLKVSRKTISRDKTEIRKELRELFEDNDEATERILEMLDTQFRSILDEYWRDRHKEGCKSSLGGIRQTVNDYINNLQSLGFIRRSPDKHEVSVDNIDSKIDDIIMLSRESHTEDEQESD